ncbi:MAG: DUF6785 family protein [Thermoproteota archaeon]
MKKEDEKHIYTMQKLEFGGKTTSEKVEEVKGVHWVYWAIVVAIVALIANLAEGVLAILGGYFVCVHALSDVFMPFTIAPLAALLPILASPLLASKRFKANLATLSRLYLVGLIVAYTIGNSTDVWKSVPVGHSLRVYYTSGQLRELLFSLWFVPPEKAIVPMIAGGAAPDWSAWAPAIFASFSYYFAFFLSSLSLTLLLRRRIIDIEKVPFPVAIAQWEAVRGIYSLSGRTRTLIRQDGVVRTSFIIGLIIGLVLQAQIVMTNLFPWWPDVLGWRAGVSPNGCMVVAPWGNPTLWTISSQLVAFGRVNIQPLNFAIAYLAPLDVSFGYWFSTVILMIAAQIAYYMGYYTGFEQTTGCCRLLGGGFSVTGIAFGISPWWGPPLYWNWMALTGGMLAFVVMVLWYAKDYLVETIRVAMGKAPPEVQVREPVSYRTIYIMLIISYIVVLVFLSSLGISIGIGLIIMILGAFLFPIAELYAYGLTGCGYGQGRDNWPVWPMRFIWPKAPQPYTVDFFIGNEILFRGINTASSGLHTWSMISGHGFRVADMTGISPRETLKFIVMAFLIALPISLLLRVWWPFAVGASRIGTCSGPWDCDCAGMNRWNTSPPPGDIAIAVSNGFIITLVLFFLRARFIWWPIHPMGFLLSGGMRSTWTGAWTNFLGAWIAKWITLKIGGSKAYTEYGIPFVGGYIAGLIIVTLMGLIIGIYRFFIPF